MRKLFEERTQREKFLVLFMLGVGFLIWATLFMDRVSATLEDRGRVNAALAEQRLWLAQRDSIRASVAEGMQNLDPARTLNATRLQAELAEVARRHGLSYRADQTVPGEPGDVFSYNTVAVDIRGANLAALINFTSDIQRRTPYMAIEQVTVTPDTNNWMRLDARYRVSSVEIVAGQRGR